LIHHRPSGQARDRRKPARNLTSSYRVIAVSIPALPNESGAVKRPLDQLQLTDLIRLAVSNGVIDSGTEQQASLAKDARNLIHPGRALRSGEACNKATALAALAAVYRLIDQLKKLIV